MLLTHAAAMFSKRPLPKRDGLPPSKRLKANFDDILLTAELSGQRTHSLYQDASHLDPQQFRDMANAGRGGELPGNLLRDMTRKLSKKTRQQWPGLYYFKCPVWDPKAQKKKNAWLCILLPHELIYHLLLLS